jgi:hypothetical protein
MSERAPQPTAVLITRLRRVAKFHNEEAQSFERTDLAAKHAARANTCWQAAARLDELDGDAGRDQAGLRAALASHAELLHVLKAATQALHSYAYGNAAPALAREVAAAADAAIAHVEDREPVVTP